MKSGKHHRLSDKTRAEYSERMKLHWKDPQFRLRFRASIKPAEVVERICSGCGKVFWPPAYLVRKGKMKFCSVVCRRANYRPTPEARAKIGLAHRGKHRRVNPETGAHISTALKRKWATDPAYKTNQIRAFRKAASSPEYRAERAAEVKALWQNPKVRADRIARIKAACSSPESHARRCAAQQQRAKDPGYRAKQSAAAPRGENHWAYGKQYSAEERANLSAKLKGRSILPRVREIQRQSALRQWQNPEWRSATVAAVRKANGAREGQTGLERSMTTLLTKMYPDEWRYTGDGDVIVGGKNPDFVHVKRQLIIETFGDYWHSKAVRGVPEEVEEKSRIDHFAKHGYRCLVVWEHEMQRNVPSVEDRIRRFVECA